VSSLVSLAQRQALSETEAEALFFDMFSGALSDVDIEKTLVALHRRGEQVPEIIGAARAAEKVARPFAGVVPADAVDTCGTGGDRAGTFNVSTAAALAAAALGVTVIKHGNRAASSKSGSADVLEALGFALDREDDAWLEEILAQRFAFLFAPKFHPGFARVGPVRKRLKHRTIFNLMGPLLNPAGVSRQVVGVFDACWVDPLAHVLLALGRTHAWVVHGGIGVAATDELAPWGTSRVAEVKAGTVRSFQIVAEQAFDPGDTCGGDANDNAEIIRQVLRGRGNAASCELVAMNVAATLIVSGKEAHWPAALARARQHLASGDAAKHWSL
jgi:anthranilate phosphoribosyltransferase